MPRVSKDRREKLQQIAMEQGRRVISRVRTRKIQFVLLLLCGGGLVVLGLSRGVISATVFGVVLILYALFVRSYVRRADFLLDELRREMEKAVKALDDKDCENASAAKRKGRKKS